MFFNFKLYAIKLYNSDVWKHEIYCMVSCVNIVCMRMSGVLRDYNFQYTNII